MLLILASRQYSDEGEKSPASAAGGTVIDFYYPQTPEFSFVLSPPT